MALNKRYHNIDMISGIDQRTDGKGLNSSFMELENGVYRKENRFEKRNGFDKLDIIDPNGDNIDALGLLSRNNAPVVYGTVRDAIANTSNPGIFIKDSSNDTFVKKTTTRMASIDKSSFFGYTNISFVDFSEDVTTGLGTGIVNYTSYEKGTAKDTLIDIVIYDYEKNKVLYKVASDFIENEITTAVFDDLASFKVINGNTKFFIFMAAPATLGGLYYYTIDKATLTLSSLVNIGLVGGAYTWIDGVYHTDEDKVILGALVDQAGSSDIDLIGITEAGAVARNTIVDIAQYGTFSLHTDGTIVGLVYFLNSPTNLVFRYVQVNPDTLALEAGTQATLDGSFSSPGDPLSPTLDEVSEALTSSISASGANECAFIQTKDSVTGERRLRAYYRTSPILTFTRYAFVEDLVDFTGASNIYWPPFFIKNSCFHYDENCYCPIGIQDDTATNVPPNTIEYINTSFVANQYGDSIASYNRYETEIYYSAPNSLSEVSYIGNKRIFPSVKSTTVSDKAYNNYYDPFIKTVERIDFEFDYLGNFQGVQNRNDLYIAGSQLLQYDGDDIVEHGFFHEPYNTSVANVGAGGVPSGTLLYAAIYKWVDAGGRAHYSKPRYFDIVIGAALGSWEYTFYPPCLTRKTNYVLQLYRFVSGNYRLVDESSTMVTLDSFADIDLLANQSLYTNGGVVGNFPAPSCKNVSIWNSRLWLTGDEVGTAYWYSKIIKENTPVEFALEFSNVIESDNRAIVGSDALGDTIVMMKDKFVYYIYGEGPNDTGYGAFSEPKLINTDAGLINPKAIKSFPLGIIFQGNNGFHVIFENKQIMFIGHRVDDYGLETVTGIDLNKVDNELLLSTDQRIIVYNYRYDRWSYHNITDVIGFSGMFIDDNSKIQAVYSDNGVGSIYTQNSTYQDNGVDFNLALKTGWIALSGISGFQRIYRLLVTGDYKSSATFNARAEYDYDLSQYDDYTLDMTTGYTVDAGFTFRNHLSKQKCKAVRFDFDIVGSGRTVDLNGITLELGVKSGAVKNNNIMTEA